MSDVRSVPPDRPPSANRRGRSSARRIANLAADLLREAVSRKWFLALGAAITIFLALVAASLRFDLVDGALAATRLFGQGVGSEAKAIDQAMKAIFEGSAWVVFYGGLTFGIVACADFGPSLLAPGRIELMLALPVRRFELLVGTWLGVLAIAATGALYAAGGLSLILGLKAGIWTFGPILAALLASITFSAIYAAMLAASLWVRSAAFSALVGFTLLFAGILAGYREQILPVFRAGAGREFFRFVTLLLPRVSALGNDAMAIAGSEALEGWGTLSNLAGVIVFAFAALAIATWRFEGKDC